MEEITITTPKLRCLAEAAALRRLFDYRALSLDRPRKRAIIERADKLALKRVRGTGATKEERDASRLSRALVTVADIEAAIAESAR